MKKNQLMKCCEVGAEIESHPDHRKELHRINRIAGQVEGVKRMISDREYCPKIITQIQATRAALKALESVILEKHLHMCVKEAWSAKDQKVADNKLSELMELFKKN